MNRERRIMLILLAVAVGVSLFGIALSSGIDRLKNAQTQLTLYRQRYLRLETMDQLPQSSIEQNIQSTEGAIVKELSHYYPVGGMDPYRFATTVRSLLSRHGIGVSQFRTSEGPAGTLLDFTTSARPVALMGFLSEVTASPKYWDIPYIHIQAAKDGGILSCDFSIGYLVNDQAK